MITMRVSLHVGKRDITRGSVCIGIYGHITLSWCVYTSSVYCLVVLCEKVGRAIFLPLGPTSILFVSPLLKTNYRKQRGTASVALQGCLKEQGEERDERRDGCGMEEAGRGGAVGAVLNVPRPHYNLTTSPWPSHTRPAGERRGGQKVSHWLMKEEEKRRKEIPLSETSGAGSFRPDGVNRKGLPSPQSNRVIRLGAKVLGMLFMERACSS